MTRCEPIRSVQALLEWAPRRDPESVCETPLLHRSVTPSTRGSVKFPLFLNGLMVAHPVLVCHDLKGGYHEDASVRGVRLADDAPAPYRFRHFDLIDEFVYFSHERVSIPPPGWTHACHVNGVRSLGTFLTEWEAGAEDNLLVLQETYRDADGQYAS